ncbi:MAG: peptide chain release factor N(5)-glutamine methyltransferase [Candidatus Falkowbacteria bacterium]
MQISQILNKNIKLLEKNGSENPHLDAELILSAVLKKPREFLFAHPEHELSAAQNKKFATLIKKRLKGVPVAYLIGHKSFYGLDFIVNKDTLVPRPETEMMVDEMSNYECRMSNTETIFIDVGTGSGCIIISLAKKLNNTYNKFIAIDISAKALTVARQNAKIHGVDKQIKLFRGNLLEPIMKSRRLKHAPRIIITANLPYLTPAQIKSSPSIKHEPKLALAAGPDGLKYYRELFSQIRKLTSQGSRFKGQMSIACEIDPSQTRKIKQLAKNELPTHEIEIKKDLAGYDRLTIIKI